MPRGCIKEACDDKPDQNNDARGRAAAGRRFPVRLRSAVSPAAARGGQVLEYRGQPMGQFQHMARIGPDGRLVSYDQVLTSENFAKVKVDHWTKDDILRNFGRPAEISRVYVHNYEVWSYRYKEAGVWNSLMSVHFDQQGVVRQMLNGPDPMYDDRFRHR
jgi:hypothetical protein